MPRNGAGTFSVINPILVGALRSSSAVNANFTDAGSEITNTIPLTGIAGMSGAVKIADGSAVSPGIAFNLDTNTGFRRSDTDEMKWVGGGTDRITMDANGKMTLAGSLAATGALTHTTGKFNPQSISSTGAVDITIRRIENDTSEHELATYASGSGIGAKGSLRLIGGGANDVATMRFYVNDILTFQWTGTLFTHSIDTLFGASGIRADADGFLDFPEITAPSNPAANIARAYARDDSGTTRLYYRDNSGNERALQPPIDRQIFTASGTWTKPAQGQTTVRVETWSGGGSGGSSTTFGGGGGGGGAYSSKEFVISSLSASVSVIVGAGGASVTNVPGNDGGTSSFGNYVSVFGGLAGNQVQVTAGVSGGPGGGILSVGSSETGGNPRGFLGSEEWGSGASSNNNWNPFGGGSAGFGAEASGGALMGGGGGGGDSSIGASSVFGGGGGGGGNNLAGGISVFGGNGGAGSSSAPATAGTAPGGGGGGGTFPIFKNPAQPSGAGGRGEVRITSW